MAVALKLASTLKNLYDVERLSLPSLSLGFRTMAPNILGKRIKLTTVERDLPTPLRILRIYLL
jgi:hypothetical protein